MYLIYCACSCKKAFNEDCIVVFLPHIPKGGLSTTPALSRFSPRNLNRQLPNRTPDKLKSWYFILRHLIEDPIKNPSANHQIIFEKCSFQSDQHPGPGFHVPRSNSRAVCSTLIGCILEHHPINVECSVCNRNKATRSQQSEHNSHV